MILSKSSIPTTIPKWINQAKIFHIQKMCILVLQGGPLQSTSFSTPQSKRDPNAMDVDAITLTKLTPAEQARCMREGWCFKCRKGYNTQHCWATFPPWNWTTPSTPCPQNTVTHKIVPMFCTFDCSLNNSGGQTPINKVLVYQWKHLLRAKRL